MLRLIAVLLVSISALVAQSSTALAQAGAFNYSGNWAQSPAYQGISFDGSRYETVIVLELKQKDSVITGTARRYLSTWDLSGKPVYVSFDMGSPGKVSGNVTASGVAIRVQRFGETKTNFSYSLTLGSDQRTLVNNNPGPFDPISFVR